MNIDEQGEEDNSPEVEKSKLFMVAVIVVYLPDAVTSKMIMKKITGSITACAFNGGGKPEKKLSAFDTYIQITDGSAELLLNDQTYNLKTGNGIIIPAHQAYCINYDAQFKMISTIIKSGYE